MTSPAILERIQEETGSDLIHSVCCNPDVAICGLDVTGDPWVDEDEDITCLFCLHMIEDRHPCPFCQQRKTP